jgi:hypothetical protein
MQITLRDAATRAILAARSSANFGFKRTLETHDSSVVWFKSSLDELAAPLNF